MVSTDFYLLFPIHSESFQAITWTMKTTKTIKTLSVFRFRSRNDAKM